MPGIANTGGAWNERERADLVGQVVSGALSIRDACLRYNLSQDSIRDWVLVFRRSAVEAFDEHLRQTLLSQGVDAGDISAAGFTGTLGDIAIADLIQTMDLGRRDGVITISHDGRESRIWCSAGEIVDAESGKLKGAQALYRALALKHGRLVADFSCAQRSRTIHAATLALLLDGARRMDECNVLLSRLGSTRYLLAPKAMSASATFTSAECAVLRSFYAPSTVNEALAENEIGDLETLQAIARLVKKDFLLAEPESNILIAPLPPDTSSTPPMVMSFLSPMAYQRTRRPSRSRAGPLGTALGLGVLGFTGWLLSNDVFESSSAEERTLAPLPVGTPAMSVSPPSTEREASSAGAGARTPWSRPEVALGLELETDPRPSHELEAVPPNEAMPMHSAGAPGVPPIAREVARAASKPGAAPTPVSRRRAQPNAASPSLVEQVSAPTQETDSIRGPLPRMQIIEELSPKMQLVE